MLDINFIKQILKTFTYSQGNGDLAIMERPGNYGEDLGIMETWDLLRPVNYESKLIMRSGHNWNLGIFYTW